MDYRNKIVEMTNSATDVLFNMAKAMPEDKLDWKPMDNGRSVMDQVEECAKSPMFFMSLLATENSDQNSEHNVEQDAAQKLTVTEWETECKTNNQKLLALLSQLSDEELEQQVELPWGGTASKADVIGYQHWNLVYHQGQISYIQTLYGDLDLHL